MDPIHAFHVVTDRPMALGQHIVFDENHHSGVFQRVMALKDTAADACAHPEKYPLPLDHHLDVALRELALEEVRLASFPQYPSRMACLYVSKELSEAKQWADYFSRLGRPTYAIVELAIRGRIFRGNACLCFDGTTDPAENRRLAKRYWEIGKDPDSDRPIWEILVDGDIEVIRIVEEINTNLP